MKNRVALCLVAVLSIAFSSASFASTHAVAKPTHAVARPAVKAAPVKVAPLDEYFGRMKLSPLGINNTIHDTNLLVKYHSATAGQYYQKLALAEDALHDWARKYPHDTWLPGRAYYMSHVFWQMHTPEGDAAAERCRQMLFTSFHTSHWAMIARNETKDNIAPVGAPVPAAAAAAAVPVNQAGAAKPPKI